MAKEELALTDQEIKAMKQLEGWKEYEMKKAGHHTLYIQYKGV